MCDQYNNRGCEVVDEILNEKNSTITDLIDEKLELQQKIEGLKSELWKRDSLNVKMVLGLEE